MKNNEKFLRTGAVAAWCSSLLLIVMAFIGFPGGLEYPGLSFLTGQINLSESEASGFFSALNMVFILDGVFLTGWIVSWIAVSKLAVNYDRISGAVILFLGAAGAILDFSENSLVFGMVQALKTGSAPGPFEVILWNAVRHLSYWFPFLGAVFMLIVFSVEKMFGWVIITVNAVLLLAAVLGLYIPSLFIASNAWFLILFLQLGFILWKSSNKGKSA